MIYNNNIAQKASLGSLEKILQKKKNIPTENAEKTLIKNIVRISSYKEKEVKKGNSLYNQVTQAYGTGLRITTDGFILTAYHNVENYIDDWKKINKQFPITKENKNFWIDEMKKKYFITDLQNNVYAIDTTFLRSFPKNDLAIIKAVNLEDEPNPIDINIKRSVSNGDYLKLFGITNKRMHAQFGRITSTDIGAVDANGSEAIYDSFQTDAYGIQGFSGGPIASLNGELIGITLYMSAAAGEPIGKIGGAKPENIVKLIQNCYKN